MDGSESRPSQKSHAYEYTLNTPLRVALEFSGRKGFPLTNAEAIS